MLKCNIYFEGCKMEETQNISNKLLQSIDDLLNELKKVREEKIQKLVRFMMKLALKKES